MARPVCVFCNSDSAILLYKETWHRVARDHGPFNFYACKNCGSGFTFPPPSQAQLTSLYNRFADGLIPATREIREAYPLDTWYRQCMDHALRNSGKGYSESSSFSWLDLGAGKGEMSKLVCERFPRSNGLAVDFHSPPLHLQNLVNLAWKSIDLNLENFSLDLPGNADIIFIITVLEHVQRPDIFLANAIRLLKPGGCLYLTTPRFDSVASKMLGRRWPYFIPGEHLNMPSVKGMHALMQRLVREISPQARFKIDIKATIIPYAAGYYAKHFGLHFLARLFPKNFLLKIPTGVLEASIMQENESNRG